MSTSQKQFIFVVLTMILSCQSFAYYNQKQGRWLSRDPLGVNPSLGGGNVSPVNQYKDGYNTYEYVRSKAVNRKDAYGLASDKVCCKLRYESSAYGDIPGTERCTQKTISNPKGFPAHLLCKCRYENGWWNSFLGRKVTSAEGGECKWCTVRLRMSIAVHMTATIDCDGTKDDFVVSHVGGDKPVSLKCPDSGHVKTFGTWGTLPGKCRTSKARAEDVYEHYKELMRGWGASGLCWGQSLEAAGKLCNECPY
ncbi:MAG TPA: hypothetical protein ENK70_08010 [Methylophaga sp.]|nr:hypothetical protein [Methylophaga sp.]